jgi:hypothetical protein
MHGAVRRCTHILLPGKASETTPRGVIFPVCVKYCRTPEEKNPLLTLLCIAHPVVFPRRSLESRAVFCAICPPPPRGVPPGNPILICWRLRRIQINGGKSQFILRRRPYIPRVKTLYISPHVARSYSCQLRRDSFCFPREEVIISPEAYPLADLPDLLMEQ